MSVTASALSQQLALQIAGYIRRSNLEPGAHLAEQRLADLFKVSRSPVRCALAELEKTGIVEQARHRGYFLKKIPAQQARAAPEANLAEERYLRIADDRLAGRLEDNVTETALMRRCHNSSVGVSKYVAASLRLTEPRAGDSSGNAITSRKRNGEKRSLSSISEAIGVPPEGLRPLAPRVMHPTCGRAGPVPAPGQ